MIASDIGVWIKYINTKQRTTDMLTKGSFNAAQRNHLCDLAQLRGSNLPSSSKSLPSGATMPALVPTVMMAQQGHAATAVGTVTNEVSGHVARKGSLSVRSESRPHRKEHKRSDRGSAGGHTSHSRTRKRRRDRKKKARGPSSETSVVDRGDETNPFGMLEIPAWWIEDESQPC